MTGLKQSAVSAVCAGRDERGTAFRQHPLPGPYPYVGLDAQYLKVHAGDRVRSLAYVVATGVNGAGDREVLGGDVGCRVPHCLATRVPRSLTAA